MSIIQSLKQMNDKTIILTSHKLSTIKVANNVVVLDQGKVVQADTFKKVLSTQGPFIEIFKSQLNKRKKVPHDGQQKRITQNTDLN